MQKEQLLKQQQEKLQKALAHLEFSYKKVKAMSSDLKNLDDESLEIWESFAIRFARVVDMYLTRYLRTRALIEDPGFNGSLRDFVNFSEKMGWLDDANRWMTLRELRNVIAHDYSEKDLGQFYSQLRDNCPLLLEIKF